MLDSSKAVDYQDIKYQHFCNVRVAPKKSYSLRVNLIAASNNLGVVFIGSSSTIQIIPKSSLQRNTEIIEEYDCHSVSLAGNISHIGLNCNEDGFTVITNNEMGTYLSIYKTETLFEKNPVPVFILHLGNQADMVSDMLWNPEINSMLAIILYNGSVFVYTIEQNEPVYQTLAPESRSVCMSWSPKGKQIVIGNTGMFLTRYKPDLTPAGSVNQIPPPSTDLIIGLVDVKWINNIEFVVIYNTSFNKPVTMRINTPKNGLIRYTEYPDIVACEINASRLQSYYAVLPLWKTILTMSSNSLGSATFVYLENNTLAQQKYQNVFPSLAIEGFTSSFPVGMTLFYNTNEPCQLSGCTYRPMPMLCILSDSGLMVIYSIINVNSTAQALCNYVEFPIMYRSHIKRVNTKCFCENYTALTSATQIDQSDATVSDDNKNNNNAIHNSNDNFHAAIPDKTIVLNNITVQSNNVIPELANVSGIPAIASSASIHGTVVSGIPIGHLSTASLTSTTHSIATIINSSQELPDKTSDLFLRTCVGSNSVPNRTEVTTTSSEMFTTPSCNQMSSSNSITISELPTYSSNDFRIVHEDVAVLDNNVISGVLNDRVSIVSETSMLSPVTTNVDLSGQLPSNICELNIPTLTDIPDQTHVEYVSVGDNVIVLNDSIGGNIVSNQSISQISPTQLIETVGVNYKPVNEAGTLKDESKQLIDCAEYNNKLVPLECIHGSIVDNSSSSSNSFTIIRSASNNSVKFDNDAEPDYIVDRKKQITYDNIMDVFQEIKNFVPVHELPFMKKEFEKPLKNYDHVGSRFTEEDSQEFSVLPEINMDDVLTTLSQMKDDMDRLRPIHARIKLNNAEIYYKIEKQTKYFYWLKNENLRLQNRFYVVRNYVLNLNDMRSRLERQLDEKLVSEKRSKETTVARAEHLKQNALFSENLVHSLNYHLTGGRYRPHEQFKMLSDLVNSLYSIVKEKHLQLKHTEEKKEQDDRFEITADTSKEMSRNGYVISKSKLIRLKNSLKKNGVQRLKGTANNIPALIIINDRQASFTTQCDSSNLDSESFSDYSISITNKKCSIVRCKSIDGDDRINQVPLDADEQILSTINAIDVKVTDVNSLVSKLAEYVRNEWNYELDRSNISLRGDDGDDDRKTNVSCDYYAPVDIDEILNAMKLMDVQVTDDISQLMENIQCKLKVSDVPVSRTDQEERTDRVNYLKSVIRNLRNDGDTD